MSDTINLYDLIEQREFIHNQGIHTHTEGLRLFIQKQKKIDGITYYFINHFSLVNIEVLKIDEFGQYYYEFSPERMGDIIDEIKYESLTDLNAKLTYYIGGVDYIPDEFNDFVFVSAPYCELKVRITFMKKPVFDDKFKIKSRYWILDNETRLLLINHNKNKVITKYNIYSDGMCKKLNII